MPSANDGTVNNAGSACRIGFIGIDVHCGSVAGGNADNNAVKDQGTSGIELNFNDLFVCNAEVSSGFGCKVDVSLCRDHAFSQGNGAAGTNKGASAGAFYVAGFTDGKAKFYRPLATLR